ncbi:hypothetical protein [Persicitalea sp.]|uniref:hypothetical protein n=1 Tax=Persicitalea sp. TaxID=3100273 RepID=UPI0035945264
MRYLYCTLFLFIFLCPTFGQDATKLSASDVSEIRAEARKVIETHLSELLNSIASSELGQQGQQLLIYDSFMSSKSQIFSSNAIIEDDISPEYTTSGKGYAELKVKTYLENLGLYYSKSAEYSIKISEVNVTEVKQGKDSPYVQVHFRSHFTNTHRNKPTLKYSPVLRTAEMNAEKVDNQWKVLIAGIRYYKAAAPQAVAAAAEAKPMPAKPAPTKPTTTTKVAAEQTVATPTKPAEKTQETKPQAVAVKTQTPPPTKPEPTPAETKPVATNAPPPTQTTRIAENKPEPAVEKKDVALTALETKAAKYQRQGILIKSGAGLAVVGAAATYFVVNSAYTDYKAGVDKSNAELQSWWDAKDANGRTNGQNFGTIDSYKAQPKSVVAFGSPGIYFVGAGIVAAGVLWAVGSGSSRKAKELRRQLEQKKLSLSPQAGWSQRYAGVSIRYKF